MDDILQSFVTTLSTKQDDDQSHQDLYKNWGKYGNQEERRNEILRQQKILRENNLDKCRGIINSMNDTQGNIFNKSSRVKYQPNVYVPGFNKSPKNYYKNVLMLSEWLVEKPEDFSTNWFVTPCPKGTRVLAVACNGNTRLYSKYGQLIKSLTTLMPGGSGTEKRSDSSVLDCFYCMDIDTIYVLDILSWKNHIFADGQFEFRRYWLQNIFRENPELEKKNKVNKVFFQLLPKILCEKESLQEFMMTYPALSPGKLDGLLFYHRSGKYEAGETPLVGWLYPYMVPEVLCPDMTIHESYAAGKPVDYVNQAIFIQQFEEKLKKKRTPFNKRKNQNQDPSETSMEAEDGPVAHDNMEEEVTEQNVNDVPKGENGVGATMETENTVNAVCQVENVERGDQGENALDTVQYTNLTDQDSMPQQAPVAKYYTHIDIFKLPCFAIPK